MAEESIPNVWTQRSLGVDLTQNLETVTSSDIAYVCNYRYPFIQLVNVDAAFDDDVSIKFITAPTGWVIHDYGGAISTSYPHDGSNSNGVLPQIDTVAAIAKMIVDKNWGSVEIIAGTPIMRSAFQVESLRCGFNLEGYEPTAKEEKRVELIKRQIEASGQIWGRPFVRKHRYGAAK